MTEEREGDLVPKTGAPVALHAYTLRLRGIRFEAYIGALKGERSRPQELVVDVELTLSTTDLPRRDRRADVIDYGAVVDHVVEVGTAEPYRLLETYARRVVERLLAETPALTVRVAVTKKRVPTKTPVDEAVVEITGSRSPPR